MKKTVWKQILSLALVVCMVSVLLGPVQAANDAVLEAKNGVVEMIMAYTLDSGDLLELSYGSGFLINENAVMTCYHCVVPDDVQKEYIELTTGKEYNSDRVTYRVVVSGDVTRTASVWADAYSEEDDWAVLRLSDTINGKNVLSLGDSDGTELTTVYALGFPDSYTDDVPKYTAEQVTATQGVVSKLNTVYGTPSIEHDADVSSGNSGGPLVNEDGVVIGVNYAYYTGEGTNYSYAIQINEIKKVLNALSIAYTDATEVSEAEEEPAEENPEEEPSEEPSAEPSEEAVAVMQTTVEPSVEPSAEISVEPVDTAEEGSNLAVILCIVGAVILVIVIVVVVVVLLGSKKKQSTTSVPPTPVRPSVAPVGGAGGAASGGTPPVAPFATSGQQRAYSAPESVGATTVLGGDGGAGETTVLGGSTTSASLTRSKNGEVTRINRNEFVIGKERAKVDCCISDNSAVSRRHAKIMSRGGKFYVVDLGSTNCTYVNGAKVSPNVENEIFNGDKLKFSDEEFIFHC